MPVELVVFAAARCSCEVASSLLSSRCSASAAWIARKLEECAAARSCARTSARSSFVSLRSPAAPVTSLLSTCGRERSGEGERPSELVRGGQASGRPREFYFAHLRPLADFVTKLMSRGPAGGVSGFAWAR